MLNLEATIRVLTSCILLVAMAPAMVDGAAIVADRNPLWHRQHHLLHCSTWNLPTAVRRTEPKTCAL